MTTRFSITELPGDPPRVEKRGDPEASAREAAALVALAGRAWAPALLAHEPGRMVTARVPGEPRPLDGLAPADARRLGAVLREVHESRRAGTGGLWWWDAPVPDLAAYREGRVADAEAALAGTPDAGLARRAAAGPAPPGDGFRLLHGDLVALNILWAPDGPVLIDWEFHRLGDPAEDLAYLAELNGLPGTVLAGVLAGYALPGMGARVEAWRGLVAADAGAWYLGQGMGDDAAAMLARARARAGISPGPPPRTGPAR